MQKLIALLFTGLFVVNSSNAQNSSNKLQPLNWLLGEWEMNGGKAIFIEHWAVVNDELWQGGGYGLNAKGDTLFKENLQVALQNDTIWYLPTIADQNDGKQVKFAAVELSPNKVVFENKQHDFPQRIVYNKTSDSTIYAYVEGIQKGKPRKEEFRFIKK